MLYLLSLNVIGHSGKSTNLFIILNLLSLNIIGHSGKSTNLFIILNKRQSLKYCIFWIARMEDQTESVACHKEIPILDSSCILSSLICI